MKLKSITVTGLHHISNKTYKLDDINYFFGPNGAGKSTILQAIQLALLGYIPGVSKKPGEIMKHAMTDMMSVNLRFSNNHSITRKWVRMKSTCSTSVETVPEDMDIESLICDLELPIFNFTEFLSQSSNQQKSWFIGYLPKSVSDIPWKEKLTEWSKGIAGEHDSFIDGKVKEIKELGYNSGLEEVVAANGIMKNTLSFKKGELSNMQSTVSSLIYYDDAEVEESSEELQAKLAQFVTKRSQLNSQLSTLSKRTTIQAQIDQLPELPADSYESDERIPKLEASLKEFNEERAKYNKKLESAISKKATINTNIQNETKMASSTGICPFINKQCDEVLPLIETAKTKISELKSSLESVVKDMNDAKKKVDAYLSKIKSTEAEIRDIKEMYSKLSQLNLQLSAIEEVDATEDSIQADLKFVEEEYKKTNDILVKVLANEKYNQLAESLTATKYKVDQEIELLKIWDKKTGPNGLQTDLMIQPFKDLESEMSYYIQTMFDDSEIDAIFNLESKANSFSFGLNRNGKYLPFETLSSGEKCIYTLALMSCLVKRSTNGLKLILVDDLFDHLDDNNMVRLIKGLRNVEGIQYVLAGVKAYDGEYSEVVKEM